ncbi:hypothetical protein BaRGS_00012614 [Batillaria attramentaria]|uniref:Uncharacterized protein n=1 Tax=Batillaria attramentaria TaxID=370345 RepID=A0ABD0L9X0_9CAEN
MADDSGGDSVFTMFALRKLRVLATLARGERTAPQSADIACMAPPARTHPGPVSTAVILAFSDFAVKL